MNELGAFDEERGGIALRLETRWVGGGGEVNELVEDCEANEGLEPPSFNACTGVCFGEAGSEGTGDIVIVGASAGVPLFELVSLKILPHTSSSQAEFFPADPPPVSF